MTLTLINSSTNHHYHHTLTINYANLNNAQQDSLRQIVTKFFEIDSSFGQNNVFFNAPVSSGFLYDNSNIRHSSRSTFEQVLASKKTLPETNKHHAVIVTPRHVGVTHHFDIQFRYDDNHIKMKLNQFLNELLTNNIINLQELASLTTSLQQINTASSFQHKRPKSAR